VLVAERIELAPSHPAIGAWDCTLPNGNVGVRLLRALLGILRITATTPDF
jgi:hypothetical protein